MEFGLILRSKISARLSATLPHEGLSDLTIWHGGETNRNCKGQQLWANRPLSAGCLRTPPKYFLWRLILLSLVQYGSPLKNAVR